MTTNLENSMGTVLGEAEAQPQGGGFCVAAHLVRVKRFIEVSILIGISTKYLFNHHFRSSVLPRMPANIPCQTIYNVNGGTTVNMAYPLLGPHNHHID